jgi:hypothetical protein
MASAVRAVVVRDIEEAAVAASRWRSMVSRIHPLLSPRLREHEDLRMRDR